MTLGKHSLEKGYSTKRYNRQYLKNAAHKSKAQKKWSYLQWCFRV